LSKPLKLPGPAACFNRHGGEAFWFFATPSASRNFGIFLLTVGFAGFTLNYSPTRITQVGGRFPMVVRQAEAFIPAPFLRRERTDCLFSFRDISRNSFFSSRSPFSRKDGSHGPV
jgi:hypothetical protein